MSRKRVGEARADGIQRIADPYSYGYRRRGWEGYPVHSRPMGSRSSGSAIGEESS